MTAKVAYDSFLDAETSALRKKESSMREFLRLPVFAVTGIEPIDACLAAWNSQEAEKLMG